MILDTRRRCVQCITLYGVAHFQEERQQALLLRRRKRSRRRQTAHCATNLFGICRSRFGTAERPDGASSGRGHLTGIRPSRSAVDGSSAFRRLGCPEIDVAAAGIRTIHSALPVVGRDSSHLPTWTEDRSGRLVSQDHLVVGLALCTRTVPLSGFLGLL